MWLLHEDSIMNRARYYDPSSGRFLSEDPIGFLGGDYNLYRYVGNNPILKVDPSGENPLILAVGIGIIALLIPEEISPDIFPPVRIPSPNNINPSDPPKKMKEKLQENKDFKNAICQK
ncbi:MAG: RHS repeat-associated core domain-containing protein [Bacteriovoracaceae bacterium]|nr:RHS repeat-associated core domain-containing protein [Bacteriovoracaceae bacterium]